MEGDGREAKDVFLGASVSFPPVLAPTGSPSHGGDVAVYVFDII